MSPNPTYIHLYGACVPQILSFTNGLRPCDAYVVQSHKPPPMRTPQRCAVRTPYSCCAAAPPADPTGLNASLPPTPRFRGLDFQIS
ncbi:hypothetical protein DFH06DRAFT_1318801 [Mycena polygramma]|nr:hypothetical protein DFH06DRAFT_1318801 [Mycena polygramma]